MIAMALSCKPKLLIADEPTTALDATIQMQILSLLKKINKELNTSILFITHDFGVVANICDYVAVMYAGKIVEYGETQEILTKPNHPYTKGLMDAMPESSLEMEVVDPSLGKKRLKQIDGSPPDLLHLPAGCSFYERCNRAISKCKTNFPEVTVKENGHLISCFNKEEAYV